MKTRKPNNTIRITLDLSPAFHERLTKLETLVDVKTKADVIRQALQCYEFMAKKTSAGYSFRLISPSGEEEKLVFFHFPEPGNS